MMKWLPWLGLIGYLLVLAAGLPRSDNSSETVGGGLIRLPTETPVIDSNRNFQSENSSEIVKVGNKRPEVNTNSVMDPLDNDEARDTKTTRKLTTPKALGARKKTQKPPGIKKKKIVKTEVINDYGPEGTYSPTSFENKLPFDGKEPQQEEDEDDDDDEDDYEDSDEDDDFFYDDLEAFTPSGFGSAFTKRPYTLQYNSKEEDDEYYYDEDEYGNYPANKDEGYDDMSFASMIMNIFYEVFARFTAAPEDDDVSDNDYDGEYYDENNYAARRTTPRMLAYRRAKRPSYNQFLGLYEEEKKRKNEISPAPVKKKEVAQSKWLPWFNEPEVETTVPSVAVETTTEPMSTERGTWGLFNLFGSDDSEKKAATPSTYPPTTAVASPNPIPALISALSEHLSTTSTTTDHPFAEPSVQKSYRNYQLWRLKPVNEEQVNALAAVRLYKPEYQWWQGPAMEGKTDVLVPPHKVDEFREFLDEEEIKYTTTIRDLQMAIRFSNPTYPRAESFQLEAIQGHPMTWHRYHRYADIIKYFEYLQRKYPRNVDLVHIGRTFEGRPIVVCHIFNRPPKKVKAKKQSIFIESGMRGNEWIGPAAATWILQDLARNHFRLTNHTLDGMKLTREWFILPVANPDGYEYTHTTDRLWTKNRARRKKSSVGFFSNFFSLAWFTKGNADQEDLRADEECLGVDLNSNFDYRWNRDERRNGRSSCSADYAGSRPFSETETRALARFLMKIAPSLKLYVSLQSYGQFISLPKKTKQLPLERFDMIESAENAVNSLRKFGLPIVKYFVDDDASLRSTAGSSDGFVTKELEVRKAFTIKLRDTGENGFLLPPSYIETTARETFEMIKILVDDLRRKD